MSGPDDSREGPVDAPDEGPSAESDGDPFAELEDVEVEDDPFESGDAPADPFTEIAVDDVDESSIWDALGAQEDAPTDVVGGELPDAETELDEEIVPKRSYCEKCEHFSAPPETACTNPGTEIRELVDMEHFLVVDCPVVAQRRGLDGYAEESTDD